MVDTGVCVGGGADADGVGDVVVENCFGEAEVCEDVVAVVGEENVLGFDVAMDDVILAAVFQCLTHLENHLQSFPLLK